ncbi:hypothetical protein HAX54_050079, partial [Datura stramonium]|nr:hypothetical protein [Datura stramonium]
TMAPNGKEVIVAKNNRKRGRPRRMKASSSAPKVGPTRRFGAKAVESHGLTWFDTQKEAKYATENWIDEGFLALELIDIREKIRELGASYIFNESERCNLTSRFNAFLETLAVDPSQYFILLEKPPHFVREEKVCVMLVCIHLIEVTHKRIVLVYDEGDTGNLVRPPPVKSRLGTRSAFPPPFPRTYGTLKLSTNIRIGRLNVKNLWGVTEVLSWKSLDHVLEGGRYREGGCRPCFTFGRTFGWIDDTRHKGEGDFLTNNDEATVLTDGVDDLDIEEEDVAIGAIQDDA